MLVKTHQISWLNQLPKRRNSLVLNSAWPFSPNLIPGNTCFTASLTSFFIFSASLVGMEVFPMVDCEVPPDCAVDMGMGVILLGCPSNPPKVC